MRRTVFGMNKISAFISVWDTTNTTGGSSASNQVKLPLPNGPVFNASVEWGDGTSNIITSNLQPETTHTYGTSGIYNIKIKGIFNGVAFSSSSERLKLIEIKKFGLCHFQSIQGIFQGCANLTLNNVQDLPILNNTNTFHNFFFGCTAITIVNRLNEWNTTHITNMSGTFGNCTNFNQVVLWNTSNVTTMAGMFSGCSNFNHPVSFNTSKVTSMASMFLSNSKLNSSITMDTANVTTMDSMFKFCLVFNKPLTFNTSKVTNMYAMFASAYAFNQDISAWDVSNVVNMQFMFENAYAFNQNISAWNFNKNVLLSGFMTGKTPANYSAANYDALLQKVASCVVGTGRTQTSKSWTMGTIKYTIAGKPYRDALIADGWSITDGGMI